MTDRKPFIKARPKAMQREGEASAEIGAGAQSLVLSVMPISSLGRKGAKVDLSWEEPDEVLVIAASLRSVAVPTYHFGHKTHRDYFFALEVVETLSSIHEALDTMTDAEFREHAKAQMKKMGLRIKEE